LVGDYGFYPSLSAAQNPGGNGARTNSGLIARFGFDIARGTAPGVYDENFQQLLGRAGLFDQNDIADAEFSVTVKSTTVSEPETIDLLALGLAAVMLLSPGVLERTRRPRQLSTWD
jgi:hypothetical protein